MDHNEHQAPQSNLVEYAKFAGVLLFIVGASYWLYVIGDQTGFSEFMRWLMGVFMATFAGFKLAGYKMFVMMFPMYDLVAGRLRVYAQVFPFMQLFLASLFLADVLPGVREVLTLLVGLASAAGVYREVYMNKRSIQCACLGSIIKLPLSTVSFFEDVAMAAMSFAMLLAL